MFFILSKIITFLIDPLFLFFCFSLFCLIKARFRFRIRILTIFIFCIIYLMATPFVSNYALNRLEIVEKSTQKPIKYDTIIVLSGMLISELSNDQQVEFASAADRIIRAMELVKNHQAQTMIISGGDGSLTQEYLAEAILLSRFAQKWGIKEEQIIVDADSKNTYENALFSKEKVVKHQFKQILLITSAFHMYRAHGCFKSVGLKVDILPVDFYATTHITDFRDFLPASSALAKMNVVIHESVGIIVYALTGRITLS